MFVSLPRSRRHTPTAFSCDLVCLRDRGKLSLPDHGRRSPLALAPRERDLELPSSVAPLGEENARCRRVDPDLPGRRRPAFHSGIRLITRDFVSRQTSRSSVNRSPNSKERSLSTSRRRVYSSGCKRRWTTSKRPSRLRALVGPRLARRLESERPRELPTTAGQQEARPQCQVL